MFIPLAPPSLRWLFSRMSLLRLLIVSTPLILSVVPAHAANILIVAGTTPLAQTAATVLNGDLGGSNTVTIVNTGVPASLTGFTQIYDVRFDNNPAFTGAEMTQYIAFLNAAPGNTLFLMGENVGFNARNTPITQFIAQAGGGTIATPTATSTASETLGAPFTTTPNAISTVKFAACGLLNSSGTGAFASVEATGGCALYFNQQTLANALPGALVVVLDVNFIATAPDGGAVNEVAFRQNLEAFVSAPPVGAPPKPNVTNVSPQSGPATGGTVVTITGSGFTGALSVRFSGVGNAASFTVNSDTSITATTPVGSNTATDVIVTTPNGASAVVQADRFFFTVPSSLPVASPTLGEWAMMALASLLGCTGWLILKKRRFGS